MTGFFSPILHTLLMGITMINVEVSRDVPLPEPRRRYPYKVMDIGDSFFVDNQDVRTMSNNNYRAGKNYARKFVARREGNGVRVWRTE